MTFEEILRLGLGNVGAIFLLMGAIWTGYKGWWVFGKSHQEAMLTCQATIADKDKQISDLRADKDRQIVECKERETMLLNLALRSTAVSDKATTHADRAIGVIESGIQR